MAEKNKYPKGIYKRGNLFWLRYAGLDGELFLNLRERIS